MMHTGKENSKGAELAKTTTGDEDKVIIDDRQRYRMMKKLTSNNPESFREVDIKQFDFNIT